MLLALALTAILVPLSLADSSDKVIELPGSQAAESEQTVEPAQAAPAEPAATDTDAAAKTDRQHILITMSIKEAPGQLENGDFAKVVASMEWVLKNDPENQEAQKILAQAKELLSKQDVVVPLAPNAEQIAKDNRREMEYRYVQANQLISQQKYAEAVPQLEMAIAIGKSVPNTGKMLLDANDLLEKAKAHQNAQMSAEAVQARKEAQQIVNLYEEKERERNKQRADEFFQKAKKCYDMREFKEALDNVNRVLAINPNDSGAKFLKTKIEVDGKEAIAKAVEEEKKASFDREIAKTYEDQRVMNGLIEYPENPVKHESADIRVAAAESKSPAIDAIVKGLQKKISVDIMAAPLPDVAKQLREVSGCNLIIDPRCASRKDLVTGLSASDTEMVNVLSMICRMNRLQWYVKDEMVVISDRPAAMETYTDVYDISDLCSEPKSFEASGSSVYTENANSMTHRKSRDNSLSVEERDARGKQWGDLVRDMVDPASWGFEKDGKGANTIQYRSGKLVVTHNAEVHAKIAKLLDAFRKARAVQVNIHARFIDINKDFLERAGVNWSGLDNLVTQGVHNLTGLPLSGGGAFQGADRADEFGIPVPQAPWYRVDGAPLKPYGEFGPTRGTPLEPPLTAAETHGRRPFGNAPGAFGPSADGQNKQLGGYLDFRGASIQNSGVQFPGAGEQWNAYGGMALDIAFLSRYQLHTIIEACRKEKQGNILTSPRVTCFNGQRANIVIARLINYIHSYDEDGTPTISTVTSGVVLEVKPYVSADQRYVTMELLPSISELRGFQTIGVSRIFMPPNSIVLSDLTGYVGIEMPDVYTRAVETTVSVPDGGTIMIGGMSYAKEQEGYSSVPLLSKIPIIKYLFMSWGRLDMRQSLVILVTADILIQTELEPTVASNE